MKQLRVERGLSLRELAGAGMSTGYLSRLERGERHPTARAIAYLAKQLELPAESLTDLAAGKGGEDRRLGQLLALADSTRDPDGDEIVELAAQLNAGSHASPEIRWRALWRIASFYSGRGDYLTELRWLTELAEISDSMDETRLAVRAYTQLARCQLVLGQVDPAMRSVAGAHALARPSDLPRHDAVETLMVLVSAQAESGQLAQAKSNAAEMLALVEDAPAALRARALWSAAMVHARSSDWETGRSLLEDGLATLDARDDALLWLRLQTAAASLYLQLDPPDIDGAAVRLREAKSALPFVGTHRHAQEVALMEARLAMETGNCAAVRELCDDLEGEDLLLGYRDAVLLKTLRGRLLIADGHGAEGVRLLESLAHEARGNSNVELAAEIWQTLARALRDDSRHG